MTNTVYNIDNNLGYVGRTVKIMKKDTWIKKLKKQEACREGVAWASQYPTAQVAWDACERADWMLWAWSRNCGAQGSESHRRMVLCAVGCAKTGVKYVKDKEAKKVVKKSLETTERWAKGEEGVTLEDVKEASDDAWIFSASSDLATAEYADYADVVANCAATGDASWMACIIAAGDAAATREKALKKYANIIRKLQPECPKFRRVTG